LNNQVFDYFIDLNKVRENLIQLDFEEDSVDKYLAQKSVDKISSMRKRFKDDFLKLFQ